MIRRWILSVCILLLLPAASWADQLELRRPAYIYKEPSRHSEILMHLDPAERDGVRILSLVEDARTNGYYHVRIASTGKPGWIYKSLVRRINGTHPEYVAYKRSLYRHWIDEDGDCQDTRAEVLVRDADGPLQYNGQRHCRVTRGAWLDPYTGKVFYEARKLDVDHVVPLKNAHESGAWAWSRERRKEYANYMLDPEHLLAVSASENRKKGAKGPDQYLPPMASYRCDYVRAWVKIKQDWELEMTEAEGEAVERILTECAH